MFSQVRFLTTLRSAKLRVGRQIAEITKEKEGGLDGATNHFTIIDAAKVFAMRLTSHILKSTPLPRA